MAIGGIATTKVILICLFNLQKKGNAAPADIFCHVHLVDFARKALANRLGMQCRGLKHKYRPYGDREEYARKTLENRLSKRCRCMLGCSWSVFMFLGLGMACRVCLPKALRLWVSILGCQEATCTW